MCNANDKIAQTVSELVELCKMADDLNAEIEQLTDQVKTYMENQNAENMEAGSYIVSFKEVVSKRLDTTGLKKLLGDALDPYYKVVTSKRFTIR